MITLCDSDEYTPELNAENIDTLAKALGCLGDALLEFIADSNKLEAFLNGKG